MAPPAADDFEEDAASAGPRLKRLAFLLTGDLHQAEDLLQTALAKTMVRWSKVRSYDQPDAFVRRVMVNQRTSWWRRGATRELATEQMPEVTSACGAESVNDSLALLAALKELPKRPRAAVVLRHWCDLSEAETARTMGCSVGTVKSNTSKGLARLRESLADSFEGEF